MAPVEARAPARQDWTRWEPLTGVAAVVLWLLGVFISEEAGNPPESEASPEQVLAWYQDESTAIVAGGFLFMLGGAFFLWFVGNLRSRLLAAEGGLAHLTALTFAGGIATAAFLIATPGADLAAGIEEDDLSPTSADALHDISDAFFVGAEVSAVVLTLAAGLAVLRTGALPRVLGWLSILLAVWLAIGPIGWAGLLLGFPLWVIAVSILLTLTPRPLGAGEPPAPLVG
jgi:hypothetical protein